MKKLVWFLSMLTCCVIVSVAHADSSCGAHLTWTLQDGTLTISGTGDMSDWSYRSPWYDDRETIQTVIIQSGCTSIGESAFRDCEELQSITIPEGVTRIGEDAFYNCERLSSITLPQTLVSIECSAFSSCTKLTEVMIPSGVTTIENSAFAYCRGLTRVELSEGLTCIGNYAFYYCNKLSAISLPASLTTIEGSPFTGCSVLASIYVPDGSLNFATVDGVLFSKDETKLLIYPAAKAGNNYSVPEGTYSLESNAFINAKELTSVDLPNTLRTIGDDCFYGCTHLQKINLPEGITSIGERAFDNCAGLTTVTLPSTLQILGTKAFISCDAMQSINVAEGNPQFAAIDGVLFDIGQTTLLSYPLGRKNPTYEIPQGVLVIGKYAFAYSDNLKQVTFPEGLLTIESGAFCGVDLVTLDFPSTLVTIEQDAFNSNDSITQVTIPENVLTLGWGAFSWCRKLASVTIEGMYTSFSTWGVCNYCDNDLVIYGHENSTAQFYATDKKIDFQIISASSTESTDTWTCPTCGTSVSGYKFCYECGTARPEGPKSCGGCGFTIPDDMTMKFCPECGAKLE